MPTIASTISEPAPQRWTCARTQTAAPLTTVEIAQRDGALQVRCSTAVWSATGQAPADNDCAESFVLPDTTVAFSVCEASRRGAAAAADMMLVRAGLRAVLGANSDIVTTVRALNRVLYRRVEETMPWPFVSGFFGIVNPLDRTLQYVSCGHDTAILFRPAGEHVHLEHNSPLLGVTEAAHFRSDTVGLKSGDALAIVTDGVTAGRPPDYSNDFFGSKRICSLLHLHQKQDAEVASWFLSHVLAFSDGHLADDSAALVAQFT